MRFPLAFFLCLSTPSDALRRWRFAASFPGTIDPQLPEQMNNPYDELADLERIFDTKHTVGLVNRVVFESEASAEEKRKKK